MSLNESTDRALEQARELQQSISDALGKASDEMKPQIENTLHCARDLQTTLIRHLEAEGEFAAKNTTAALSHLQDYVALGAQALQDSSDQLRSVAKKMLEQSLKIVEAAAAAAGAEPSAKPAASSTEAPKAKEPDAAQG